MKKRWWFLLLTLAACKPDQGVSPVESEVVLQEVGPNDRPVSFSHLAIFGLSSQSSQTLESELTVGPSLSRIKEAGFCLSATDSLPSRLNPAHQHIAGTLSVAGSSGKLKAQVKDLLPGRRYFLDTYVVLEDGRVFYGRFNHPNRTRATPVSAVSFRLPERPALQATEVIQRPDVPVPAGKDGTSPVPELLQFVVAGEKVYAYHPMGALVTYDAVGNRWQALPSVPVAVAGMNQVFFGVGGKLYLNAAAYGGGNASRLWSFDPVSQVWKDLGARTGPTAGGGRPVLVTADRAYFSNSLTAESLIEFSAAREQFAPSTLPNLKQQSLPNAYQRVASGAYFADVWKPGGSLEKGLETHIVGYDPTTDRLSDQPSLMELLAKWGYTNRGFMAGLGEDLLIGYGSTNNLIISPGTLGATGTFIRQEVVRYSPGQQAPVAFYNLSGVPNPARSVQIPLVVGNRFFVMNTEGPAARFTEVVLPR